MQGANPADYQDLEDVDEDYEPTEEGNFFHYFIIS